MGTILFIFIALYITKTEHWPVAFQTVFLSSQVNQLTDLYLVLWLFKL